MKKLCASIIVLSMIGASFLYADTMSAKIMGKIVDKVGDKVDEGKNVTQEMLDAEVKNIFGKNRNGVLLGIGFRYAGIKSDRTADESYNMLDLRIGYQNFPGNRIFGYRAYADTYLGIKDMLSKSQSFATVNLDALADFKISGTYSYWGIFAGVGYGIIGFNSGFSSTSEFINFGIAYTAGAKHRIEGSLKVPMKRKFDDKDENTRWEVMPTIFGVMYQFTF